MDSMVLVLYMIAGLFAGDVQTASFTTLEKCEAARTAALAEYNPEYMGVCTKVLMPVVKVR